MATGALTVTIIPISTGPITITMTTTMPDSDVVLTLAQWFSPSFPIGAFSYSHGLETMIADGQVTDAAAVETWVADILQHGAGRSDVIFIAAAYAADAATHTELDGLARALAPSQERLAETVQQGSAFARTIRDVWGHDVPDMALPVAVGAAAATQDLPLQLTAETYLHSFAANLISAAIRLVPLGQTDGQRIVQRLKPLITAVAGKALAQTIDDLGSNSFAADIASMRHETQYSRIFRS